MNAAIRKVLWEQWDPVGVNDTPEAFDEYDSYAGGIQSLLLRGASDAPRSFSTCDVSKRTAWVWWGRAKRTSSRLPTRCAP